MFEDTNLNLFGCPKRCPEKSFTKTSLFLNLICYNLTMKKYEVVVVLTAGITQNNEGLHKFDNGRDNFNYEVTGDPYDFRLKAIRKLCLNHICTKFILVGGEVEILVTGKKNKFKGSNGEGISKAEVMRHSLLNDYQVHPDNLICLKSESNTKGNAEEILRYFKQNNIRSTEGFGLLTNFYHLPRATRTFLEVTNLPLIPISAEAVIYNEEFENITKFYQEDGFMRILGKVEDQESEIKGLAAKEDNSYLSNF